MNIQSLSPNSIICINGSLPSKGFFSKWEKAKIIACDGAINGLIKNNIMPSYLIGDMDSIDASLLGIFTETDCKRIYNPCQETTDFEKAIKFTEHEALFPSIVVGINGGEIDHIMYNIMTVYKHATKNNLCFYDISSNSWGFIIEGKANLYFNMNTVLSIFSYDNAIVSTTGLKWELDKKHLNYKCSSVRNLSVSPKVEVDVIQGKIILITK